jgi:Family of unknown function (DUF6441)
MKLAATIARSLQTDIQAELRGIEGAVAAGTREAGRGLKTELRRQVTSAGLGQRLANSWRDRHYPNRKLDAAALVYTKAPQIIRAFDEGAVIRSRRGRFLAIPTENAPRKGTDGKRISPSTFPEHRFGPLDACAPTRQPRLLPAAGPSIAGGGSSPAARNSMKPTCPSSASSAPPGTTPWPPAGAPIRWRCCGRRWMSVRYVGRA